MTNLPIDVEKIINSKVAEKLYDDGVSDTAKEISKVGVDISKTARLLLAPLQLTAAFQDRVEIMIDRIRNKVPEERRIEAPAELVGPTLEKMKFLEEDSLLWEMFEEILTRSIDNEAIKSIHPSYSHIISQLSRDEALILYKLTEQDFKVVDTMDLNVKENRFENLQIEESQIPTNELFMPEKVHFYHSHLESLNLVHWPIEKQDSIVDENNKQTGVRRYSKIHLTEFGRLFVSACVPSSGFRNI